MPAPVTRDDFLELGYQSGVLDRKVIDDFLAKRPADRPLPTAPKDLAILLIREGLLTTFQAEHLLAGKWRGFIISGKYRLLQRVGSGGMGSVYLCEHILMRRRVALKVLPVAQAEDPAALDRFYREARAVAALDDPNIVRAHDIDHEGKLHFLVLEYVDGVSLQDLVKRRGPLDVARACHYIRQAAYGLQHAHEAGLVHRDIKPGNLLVDRGGVIKLLDMGLARFFHDDRDELTKHYDANSVLGTADYLAPEQAVDSHGVDIRADIYSLGITFYFLLTGQTPFQDGTVAQKLIWHQVRQPKPIQSLRPEVPEEVAALIAKMISKDPAQRPQTPLAVAEALSPWTRAAIDPPHADDLPPSLGSGPSSSALKAPRSSASVARGPLSPQPSAPGPNDSVRSRPRLEATPTHGTASAVLPAATPTTQTVAVSSIDTPAVATQRTVVVPGTPPAIAAVPLKPASTASPKVQATTARKTTRAKSSVAVKRIVEPPDKSWDKNRWLIAGAAVGGTALVVAVFLWMSGAGNTPEPETTGPPATKRAEQRPARLEHAVGLLRTQTRHDKKVSHVALTPDGRRIISTSHDKTARVWDLASGKEEIVCDLHNDSVYFVAVTRDGKRAATCGADRTIRVWEVDTGRASQVLNGADKRVRCAVFTPDGKRIFSGGDDANARLWNIASGKVLRLFDGKSALHCVAVAPDGSRALTGCADGSIKFWDLERDGEPRHLSAHAGIVASVQFSPDGQYVLSGGDDKMVHLYDADTRRLVHAFDGHIAPVWIVAFSSDGKRALSGGADKTLRLWDLEDKRLVHTFVGHGAGVTGAAFTPDSRFAVSSSADATIRVWGLP
jgi:serine/threonine protein kinase/WD40 repeat protein